MAADHLRGTRPACNAAAPITGNATGDDRDNRDNSPAQWNAGEWLERFESAGGYVLHDLNWPALWPGWILEDTDKALEARRIFGEIEGAPDRLASVRAIAPVVPAFMHGEA